VGKKIEGSAFIRPFKTRSRDPFFKGRGAKRVTEEIRKTLGGLQKFKSNGQCYCLGSSSVVHERKPSKKEDRKKVFPHLDARQ